MNVCLKNQDFFKKNLINFKFFLYYFKCRKKTRNLDPKIFEIKNNKLIMQSKCTVCKIKKSRFMKEQEAKVLLSSLSLKNPLSKVSLIGNILF